jgi:L-arabinose isomerase
MINNPKIGLLPLYIELYDISNPEMRDRINAFLQTIEIGLKQRDLHVVTAPVCRLKPEFQNAVESFEKHDVDAIVTLHLAYSPSLESADILAKTKLPIIVLDTTPTYEFGPEQNEIEIMYNHGIHGAQDMCNLLIRNKKRFMLEAGHWEKSDVLDRIAGCARAAKLIKNICTARVGIVGEPFKGMGDFVVPTEILEKTIGIKTISFDFNKAQELANRISDEDIIIEMEENKSLFEINSSNEGNSLNKASSLNGANGLNTETHRRSTYTNLLIRNWIEKEKLTAFTVNFLATSSKSIISTMPFLEASKAMGRGLGYAGEGDVLTAALVGVLAQVYPETSFTEMFCPDWKNNSIFLSHMGEMNINLTAEKPVLVEKEFPYTDAYNPIVAYGRFKAGEVIFVNLAPKADNKYGLILSKGNMLDVTGADNMKNSIHGWFKPTISIENFLTEYSLSGGTHHAAIVYGDDAVCDEIKKFGEIMSWDVVVI